MSIRVSRRAPKGAIAIAGVVASAMVLSGCTMLGGRAFGDPTVTGSTYQSAPGNINQPMPANLGAAPMQTAAAQFLPPADVGFGTMQPSYAVPGTQSGQPSVVSQDLPVLSPQGVQQAMPAPQTNAAAALAPRSPALGSLPANLATPTIAAVAPAANANVFRHTIASGESLYTIARRYDVTTQAIVQANGMSSPDKIVVGQSIIIPGRADLLASRAPTQVASAVVPIVAPLPAAPQANALQVASAPAIAAAAPAAPTQVAAVAPAVSSDKFRWPVSGRVITDFAASKATGINIEAAEGTPVKAAENGTVIYVGSGVEGYGNLILIRHANGFVSAYAHLQSMSVAKGNTVNRGDAIGAAGMTGSVSKPQLHFELRKGATPVDPVPLLAS